MTLRLVRVLGGSVLAWLCAIAIVACGGSDSDGGGSAKDEPLKIGFAAALTGDAAFADVPARAGVDYAVEQINANGGIEGRKIELTVKDMKSDPKLAGAVAQSLLDSGAAVLIGPPFPANNIGVMQAGAKEGVATVLPLETDPVNAEVAPGTVIFSAYSDTQQAAAAAEYALKQGEKTAVTVTSPDGSYTENTPKYFASTFTNGGGKILGDAQFSIGQTEFDSVAKKVAGFDPNIVYTAMFPPDTPIFLKALRREGFDGPVYGPDGFDSPALIDVARGAAERTLFTANGFPEPGGELAKVVAGIEESQGKKPESAAFAGLGYDAVQMIKAAVEKAGSVDPGKISEAFASIGTTKGVTGDITVEGKNQFPTKPVTVIEIKDGEFTLAEQLVPSDVPEPLSR